MKGGKGGRVEGWKGGRVEGWKGGRVEGWKGGRVEGWKGGSVEGWRVEGWSVGWRCSTCFKTFTEIFNFKSNVNNSSFADVRGLATISVSSAYNRSWKFIP